MKNTVKKFYIKHSKLFQALLIFVVFLFSFGQVAKMYFWQDDSALIFKLQHQQEPAGSYGAGIIGQGPYKYLVTPFVPFYPLFGINPMGYFVIGLVVFALAAAAFYFFCKELTDKKVAFFSTLIFVSAAIGSDTMYRISNSWQTNFGLILALLTLLLFARYLKSSKFVFYLLTLAFYFASIEFVYVRSHSLIFPILVLDILYCFPFNFRKISILFIRQVPFWLLFNRWYLQDSGFGGPGLSSLFQEVVFQHKLEVLSPLLANFGNGLIPDVLQNKFLSILTTLILGSRSVGWQVLITNFIILCTGLLAAYFIARQAPHKIRIFLIALLLLAAGFAFNIYSFLQKPIWYRDVGSVFSGILGIELPIVIGFYAILQWKKDRNLSIGIILGLIIVISQIFGYFSQYQTAIFSSDHRYFSYSLLGYALVFGILSYYFFGYIGKASKSYQLLALTPLVLVVGINAVLNFNNQHKILVQRSIPTRNFYQQLLKDVPSVQKGSVFYFDVDQSPFYQQQFSDFFSVGSMPNSTALAIYYGIDRDDINFITDSNDLLLTLSKNPSLLNNTYTFYYGASGLIDTTTNSRIFLGNGLNLGNNFNVNYSDNKLKKDEICNVGNNFSLLLDNLKIDSSTPTLVKFNLSLSPNKNFAVFPYCQERPSSQIISDGTLNGLVNYLRDRQKYYSRVKVSSISDWPHREVRNVADNDPDSVWEGGRIWWHDHRHEQLTVDLGAVEFVSEVIWQNWKNSLTPTDYTLAVSTDGQNWQIVKTVKNGGEKADGQIIEEKFNPVNARLVRMDFTGTILDDAPAIAEFEAVKTEDSVVDQALAKSYAVSPFAYIDSQTIWDKTFSAFNSLMKASFIWKGNAVNASKSLALPVSFDGKPHDYQLVIPAGGLQINQLSLEVNAPVTGTVNKVEIAHPTLKELIDLNYIKGLNNQ